MSDTEAERLAKKLMTQVGDDVQHIYDHEALFKQAATMLRYLSAQLAEATEKGRQQGLRVKPLEWFKSHINGWNEDWHTTTPIIYTVRCADENGWKWSFHGGQGYCGSPESAKAAAQADYEARILSALEPAPTYEEGRQQGLGGKYDRVLLPFLSLMERELHANAGKGDRPGWLEMDVKTALLEIYYHLGKLQKAAKNGDGDGIQEHSADVANMSMMLADICGVIPEATLARMKESTDE